MIALIMSQSSIIIGRYEDMMMRREREKKEKVREKKK